jgi:recombination protein U
MTTKTNELEKTANAVHIKYRKNKTALILKVPVPILMTNKGLIAQQSTVDYTGLINDGTFIAFDAKETLSKTSFPLSNIHQHQLVYLEYVQELNGIAFFMIHFKNVHKDKVYITPLHLIKKFWYGGERKSIPLSAFDDNWLTTVENYINKLQELKDELFKR